MLVLGTPGSGRATVLSCVARAAETQGIRVVFQSTNAVSAVAGERLCGTSGRRLRRPLVAFRCPPDGRWLPWSCGSAASQPPPPTVSLTVAFGL